MRAIYLVLALSTGCIKSSDFHCDTNTDCGNGGQCELTYGGYCSFLDSSCTVTGRKFGDSSGQYSNQCVGEGPMIDAPNGGEMPGGEPAPMGCPAGYADLSTGPTVRMHHYKVFMTAMSYAAARSTCSGEGAFLAFPDGTTLANAQAELAALRTDVADGAWVGVEDIQTKGTWVTSLLTPASAITKMLLTSQAGSGPDRCEDIVSATKIDDANCGTAKKFVCECVP